MCTRFRKNNIFLFFCQEASMLDFLLFFLIQKAKNLEKIKNSAIM
ncbi:hypothetical protein FUSO4_06030 [Fusobacterium necrophorum DJ-1]|nr:hypothetical protein FUSO4_06030 [Fusobacterium necrophorum DJ-1]KDE70837.1 hypothetical protein FUSO6_03075 [Fusobacterium necrophorum DAB]